MAVLTHEAHLICHSRHTWHLSAVTDLYPAEIQSGFLQCIRFLWESRRPGKSIEIYLEGRGRPQMNLFVANVGGCCRGIAR